jgi:queuine tRNA-ribosyltransferase
MLGLQLLSLHNIYFFLNLTKDIRASIAADKFSEFKKDFLRDYDLGNR